MGRRGIGRSKRKPSSIRYAQSERWVRNKAQRVAKHMRKFRNYTPHNLSRAVADRVSIIVSKGEV